MVGHTKQLVLNSSIWSRIVCGSMCLVLLLKKWATMKVHGDLTVSLQTKDIHGGQLVVNVPKNSRESACFGFF